MRWIYCACTCTCKGVFNKCCRVDQEKKKKKKKKQFDKPDENIDNQTKHVNI